VQVVIPATEAAAVVLRLGLGAAEELDALDTPVPVAPRLAVDGLELDAVALRAVHTVDAPIGLAGLLGPAGDVAGAAAGSGDRDAAAPAAVCTQHIRTGFWYTCKSYLMAMGHAGEEAMAKVLKQMLECAAGGRVRARDRERGRERERERERSKGLQHLLPHSMRVTMTGVVNSHLSQLLSASLEVSNQFLASLEETQSTLSAFCVRDQKLLNCLDQ
jgi:hypothetical protein